jgi:hypothetical protein
MNQPAAQTRREQFDRLVNAAEHASSLTDGAKIAWKFNGVTLDTDMFHQGDLWDIFTELNAEMAN